MQQSSKRPRLSPHFMGVSDSLADCMWEFVCVAGASQEDLHRLLYAQGECDGPDQFEQEPQCDTEILQVSVVWVCAVEG